MVEQQGLHTIQQLRRRWRLHQLLAHALVALAVALLLSYILHVALQLSFGWALVFFVIMLAGLIWWRNPRRFTHQAVARFLDQHYPELEESSTLMLQPSQQLTLLERLQQHKVETALQTLPVKTSPFNRQLRFALIALAAAMVLSLIIVHLPFNSLPGGQKSNTAFSQTSGPEENILPQIDEVNITITPPAYTGKSVRQQEKFTLNAEDGAMVKWLLHTNVAIHQAYLLLNGKTRLPLHTGNSRHTRWNAQLTITTAGFYQVGIDDKLSDLYPIHVVKDALPVIHIKTPKPYTYIDAGETPKVLMNALVSDDYGIADALLVATVAKGSGEGVKFKEYKMPFAGIFGGHHRQYQLQKLFDLPALQMEPGDELYFYLQAQDTRRQQSRTDIFKITLQDTAQLLSMDGVVTGSTLKPEFFRSERQIIIDTEGLLKARDSINANEFNNRCNNIATDQKLLRLRYGKFLGEEDEGKVGEAEEGSDLGKVENFNNAEKIIDAYTDKHDKAEDATFFEPAIKAQLKATLNEMWRAELQLRLYKPGQALPYEYKALRLLKDLQQKSRAYVAKTNYNPPPIKPEKRLSGDLSKINTPASQYNQKPPADVAATVKRAIAVLVQLHDRPALTVADKQALQAVAPQLNQFAAEQGGRYLKAVTALRQLLSTSKPIAADKAIVEAALLRMLPPVKPLPNQAASAADMSLGKSYYQHLNRMNR
ncbi:hypothetical protein [Mucilaginibacter sp.]